ncbi:hypothetical protein P154DRAFT_581879 [Amniculicola lignicola CBS 123094]|uniref:Uncharacterized protein n=1 Tax=Amniculicola lignicola CBS 123094 TaxID=1392246 RepID=A0A6A5W5K8_9PLEO|nr:hypothetical protein P154DRAFT_581879 [Amniculicola lignicola CBS 123094]
MPTAKESGLNTTLCWRFTQRLNNVQTAGHMRHNGTPKTSAKPIPDFAPLYKDDPSSPKVVNFSINLVPSCGSSLESAIYTLLLLHEPSQFLSINQTLNEAYKKPAVISIKIKKGFYEEEDARFKLGI